MIWAPSQAKDAALRLPVAIRLLKHPVPPPPTPYRIVRVPAIGDGTAGFTNDSAAYAGEFVFTNQVVLLRQGRYCAIVHISGDYGQVPLRTAVGLGRLIDGRITG